MKGKNTFVSRICPNIIVLISSVDIGHLKIAETGNVLPFIRSTKYTRLPRSQTFLEESNGSI